jgi:flagellar biosynthesis protein FlhF
VGKTTTLAKLAARERLERNRSVLLVSCDGFRVGAIDQLERFAHLIGARFAVASAADELAALIESATEDSVMVDTSGRPPVPDGVEGLLARQIGGRDRHVILCATAATRAVDAQRIARVFGPLRADAICVTKLDETDAPAGVLHLASAAKLPVAILCNGQRVPEDLREATTAAIVDLLSPAAPATLKEAS